MHAYFNGHFCGAAARYEKDVEKTSAQMHQIVTFK